MALILVFRRYAPFKQFGFGFEGDNRSGPSVSMSATARTIGMVPFERGSIGALTASSSGTEFTGAGDWLKHKAGRHTSKVSSKLVSNGVSVSAVRFTASTAGANPMVPGAPAIDTFVDFSATWIGNSIRFEGGLRGDDFPNAEVFVVDPAGKACLLFDGRTTGGQDTGPMTRLAGTHDKQKLGSFFTTLAISDSDHFLAAKTTCVVTTM